MKTFVQKFTSPFELAKLGLNVELTRQITVGEYVFNDVC